MVAFATLGNRAGLASSGAMAATIFAADFSGVASTRSDVHALIIATWVLFLGCSSVLQTQIHAVALQRCGAAAKSHGIQESEEFCAFEDDPDEWDLPPVDYGQVPDAMHNHSAELY